MSNLDKILEEMKEDDINPMPEIKVGDLLFVESLHIRNLALVVAEVDNELIIHFPLRIGNFGIPWRSKLALYRQELCRLKYRPRRI